MGCRNLVTRRYVIGGMGVQSTYYITRETAIAVVVSKVFSLPKAELERILEGLPGSELKNYWVLDSISTVNPDMCIHSVEEF